EALAELQRDDARDDVGGAAGRVRHDHPHRLRRIGLRMAQAGEQQPSDPDRELAHHFLGAGWILSTQCTSSGFSTTGMSRFTTTGSWPLRQSTQESGSSSFALISWCGTYGGT